MPQIAMRQPIAMGQFSLARQLLMGEQQQVMAAAQQQPAQQKPTKVTKVRRTRQSRNPQLSVARRNERERNRVKMVNNGFALLRNHLPIEYLQQTHQGYESAGSDTPDLGPVGAKSPASQSSKAKKFSKVETLRAAIQHIKMLEELMRSAEPDFETINIQQKQDDNGSSSHIAYDEIDSGPLSCGDGPLSCGSSSSLTSSSLAQTGQQTGVVYMREHAAPTNAEQFVKLEPFSVASHIQFQAQPASPFDSAGTTIQTPPVSQQHQPHHHSLHYSQAPAMMTQVQNQQTIASSETATSEHTHLWIQQHQSSFMEQQQQHYNNSNNNNNNNIQDQWSPYQPQYIQQQEMSPTTNVQNGNVLYQHQQPMQQMRFSSQQQQLDSPPAGHWFAPSPPNSTIQQQIASESVNFSGHHQISLYSQ